MKKTIFIFSLFLFVWNTHALADNTHADITKKNKIIWTAVFRDITTNNPEYSDQYCFDHTPVVIIATFKQIMSKKGVTSSNGIKVRYLSHETQEKNGLYFNVIQAVLSGKDETGKPWSTAMRLYEHTLSPSGQTFAVWSTVQCKGTFTGIPTVMH